MATANDTTALRVPTDASRDAQREQYSLADLGRMPGDVRDLAYSYGGTCPGAIALYQVASTDGLTRDAAELRAEIASIGDPADRAALLRWLDTAEG
jgi:hypothetical protein